MSRKISLKLTIFSQWISSSRNSCPCADTFMKSIIEKCFCATNNAIFLQRIIYNSLMMGYCYKTLHTLHDYSESLYLSAANDCKFNALRLMGCNNIFHISHHYTKGLCHLHCTFVLFSTAPIHSYIIKVSHHKILDQKHRIMSSHAISKTPLAFFLQSYRRKPFCFLNMRKFGLIY